MSHLSKLKGAVRLAAVSGVMLSISTCLLGQSNKQYVQNNLVSDQPGVAEHVDPLLIDPWGVGFSATSPYWVSNRGSGTTTLYDGYGRINGLAAPTIVTIPRPVSATGTGHSTPTGQVQNPVAGFAVQSGKNASFIFVTEDGTVSGWNSSANATNAITMVDNSATGAVYKGLALYNNGTSSLLFAANFGNATIDVFDINFAKASVAGGFKDTSIPAGFAPFNVAILGGKIYVTYAKQNAAKNHDLPGAGNGYVDIFDTAGNLLQNFAKTGTLNSPWGIAIAPSTFGAYAGNVLVGNFGDGTINAFDATTGASQGQLLDTKGNPIAISGLWALFFGNGNAGSDAGTLYFTAGPVGETHGLLGSLQPSAALAPPTLNANALVNGASYAASTAANGSLAPGSIASLFGLNLTTVTGVASGAPLPTVLGDTMSLSINGINAPLFFAANKQVNLQVPFELAPGTYNLSVSRGTIQTATQPVTIVAASPGIFTTAQTGAGQGAILNTAGVLVTSAAPAGAGDVVSVYCTGLGATSVAVASGVATPLVPAIASKLAVTASVAGVPATVQFAGLAGGFVGLNQVNVVIPAGVVAGSANTLVLTINGVASNTVTLATK